MSTATVLNVGIPILVLAYWLLIFWFIYRFVRSIPKMIRVLRKMGRKKAEHEREIEALRNVTQERAGSDLYEAINTYDIIGLNRQTHEMVLGTLLHPVFIPFEKIRHAEIVQGGVTLIQTNRLQGLQPWVGLSDSMSAFALRDAITADRQSREMITNLSIKVTIDDWNDPVRTICFLRADDGGIDPRSQAGSAAIAMVDDVYARLGLIIGQYSGGATNSTAQPTLP